MAPNHGGEPLGSILGPMGSHWGQKMGQNRLKLPCPKSRIFCYSARSSIWAKIDLMVMAPNHGGDPLGSILGPMGYHWGQKMGIKGKKLPCPKLEFFATPRSSIWAKNRIYGDGAKSWWGPPRVHLGANGVPLGPKKWIKTVKNYHARKFGFWLLLGNRFGRKIELTVMAPNHGGEPLGSILGPMGSHWGQKMGQNRLKLPCPKSRIFNYSAVIDLGKNSTLWLWRQIMVGTP